MNCSCCRAPIRLMCEVDYCGSRCRRGKCGHPKVTVEDMSRLLTSYLAD